MRALTPAAIVTAGTEIVAGARLDTNTQTVALALRAHGFAVREAISVPDDAELITFVLARLIETYPLVVVTGGLGPTHDDVTREAAARALGRPLRRDETIAARLTEIASQHAEEEAAKHVLRQADVIDGATVLLPSTGTAPGQIVATSEGHLLLLPGPPSEMQPMLDEALAVFAPAIQEVRVARCACIRESDAQVLSKRALAGTTGIGLTVLASPALVDVLLFDEGAGAQTLARAHAAVVASLGDACYSEGASLPEVVLERARVARVRLATAESCTGGLVSEMLTSVPGSSDVFVGGVVAYANEVKRDLLCVPDAALERFGAVSEPVARAMAEGAASSLGATHAVAITGIAGPTGGTPDKPVGTVWIGLATRDDTQARTWRFAGPREQIRARAAVHALDWVRRVLQGSGAS